MGGTENVLPCGATVSPFSAHAETVPPGQVRRTGTGVPECPNPSTLCPCGTPRHHSTAHRNGESRVATVDRRERETRAVKNGGASPWEGAEPLLTSGEVALMFGVDTKTVGRWANAGLIGSIRTPGGHRRFRQSEVTAFLVDGVGDIPDETT